MRADRNPYAPLVSAALVPPGPSGVRDYGRLLAAELRRRRAEVDELWLVSDGSRFCNAGRAALSLLASALTIRPGAVVIWHYSPFAYAYRGVPLAGVLYGVLLRLRRTPMVVIIHEVAYPWNRRGLRGAVLALAQRVALVPVLLGSTAVIVTTQRRADGLRRVLRVLRRTVHVIPVFSTLGDGDGSRTGTDGVIRVAVLGYTGDGACPELLFDALRAQLPGLDDVRAVLVGAPGPNSADGQRLAELIRRSKVDDRVEFSGILPEAELSRCLAACDIAVFVNDEGPSGRRTTLAAALAHGVPVVALDGPSRWKELLADDAVVIVQPDPFALASAIARLVGDVEERSLLGARGRHFYENHMSLARVADEVELVICAVRQGVG